MNVQKNIFIITCKSRNPVSTISLNKIPDTHSLKIIIFCRFGSDLSLRESQNHSQLSKKNSRNRNTTTHFPFLSSFSTYKYIQTDTSCVTVFKCSSLYLPVIKSMELMKPQGFSRDTNLIWIIYHIRNGWKTFETTTCFPH